MPPELGIWGQGPSFQGQVLGSRNPLCPSCRRMRRLQVRAWWLDGSHHARSIGPSKSNIGRKTKRRAEKHQKRKFSEVGLPGVEKDPTPRGIILKISRHSQLPYMAKYIFPEVWG